MFRHPSLFPSLLLAATLCIGCDEEKKPSSPDAAPNPNPSPSATTAPKPRGMPEVILDGTAVHVGIDELRLSVPSFDSAFSDLLKKVPVAEPTAVVFNVERKTPMLTVNKIAYALFDAGAKSLEIRTKPRGTFPEKLVVVSQQSITKPPPCTIVAMVLDDLGATFWPVRGDRAKRYSKGMAGPDLSAMHQVLQKEAGNCSSTTFYFSAQDPVEWGHAFDLATSTVSHEPAYKFDKYVLLKDIPVPGKVVKASP